MCGSCHADVERMRAYGLPTDQYAKYLSSVHGQRLLPRGHPGRGLHRLSWRPRHQEGVRPDSPVFAPNVPALCASCHADAERMEPYGIPTDQYEIYPGASTASRSS